MENELIWGLIGVWIIYSWIHAGVIIFKKLPALPTYEKVVSWTAFVSLVLFMIGYFME